MRIYDEICTKEDVGMAATWSKDFPEDRLPRRFIILAKDRGRGQHLELVLSEEEAERLKEALG